MKKPTFIAKQEISATTFADILAFFLNTRFVMFLGRFAEETGIPREKVFDIAYKLMKDAEIPQEDE